MRFVRWGKRTVSYTRTRGGYFFILHSMHTVFSGGGLDRIGIDGLHIGV